ncbi:MAG: PilW family protein [Burkholderiales bacterium]
MHPNTRIGNGGFSLVEVMVGMIIGMLGIIVVFQVFAASESQKRTTSGGVDAQVAANTALFTLEREARLGGYGFADTSFLGCNILAYDDQRPAGAKDFTVSFTPVTITQGALGTPDTLRVTYSASEVLVVGQAFTQPSPASANYKLSNRTGFNPGDLVVAAETIAGVPTCTLAEITSTPGTPGNTDVVIHNNGTYTNSAGQNVSARYNKPGGLGVTYTAGTLYNLGPLPRSSVFFIEGANRLSTQDDYHFLDADANAVNDSIELADDVIDLQAQYGVDNNNDGVVSGAEFQDADPANWARLKAIRLAILSRSKQLEKTQITTAAPSWDGGNFTMNNPDAATDWRNYRYRVHQTVIPLRNMIWGQN